MRSDLLFWDVDTQHDFMRADGRLYVPDSQAILGELRTLTDFAHRQGIRILASSDDHLETDAEISDTPDWIATFPPHCMRGTPGQRKVPETTLHHPMHVSPGPMDPGPLAAAVCRHEGDILFTKHTVDSFTNPNLVTVVRAIDPAAIVLYGVATDVCNHYAVEGILRHFPGIRLSVVTDAMRAISVTNGEALLVNWAGRGVRLITTAEATAA